MKQKLSRILIRPLLIAALAACGLAAWFYLGASHYGNVAPCKLDSAQTGTDHPKYLLLNMVQRRQDILHVDADAAECLVLSMTQPDYFPADDFAYYRGISTTAATHTFTDLHDIKDFLETVNAAPSSVYLALDPVRIASLYDYNSSSYEEAYQSTLLDTIRSNTGVAYEFLLTFPSLDYWSSLSDSERENALASYRDFVNLFAAEENVRIYFPGSEEWLIANPGNYESDNVCNDAVMRKIIALTIDGNFGVDAANIEEKLTAIRTLAAGTTTESLLAGEALDITTDLSDVDLVFFGDSVIGNFNDSTSIPGVVAGFTGAHVYNLGLGGTAATSSADSAVVSLITIVNAFLEKNASPLSDYAQITEELETYIADHSDRAARTTCFIFNYGLNDYFMGYPISSPQTEDQATCYTGAFREAVSLLREAYPDCRVLLMSPNFCSYFENGTTPQSDAGGTLAEYADAVVQLAAELNVEVIDNYRLGINSENHSTYLHDGCHPNELGRYIIGRHIIEAL